MAAPSEDDAKTAEVGTEKAERRDRVRRLLVGVTPSERAEIERRAAIAGMSVAGFLRAAALNHETRSTLDYEAAMALAKVGGDLGRLGGLLKLWLSERRGEGAPVADVNRLLRETRALQDQLRDLVGRM